MMKKYIYLAKNGLSLSSLQLKYVTTNWKDFLNWLKGQKKYDNFVELEIWKIEEGKDLNSNNMIYIGDGNEVLDIDNRNKKLKNKKKKTPVT